jgi:hypothetical protein
MLVNFPHSINVKRGCLRSAQISQIPSLQPQVVSEDAGDDGQDKDDHKQSGQNFGAGKIKSGDGLTDASE